MRVGPHQMTPALLGQSSREKVDEACRQAGFRPFVEKRAQVRALLTKETHRLELDNHGFPRGLRLRFMSWHHRPSTTVSASPR